MSLNAETILAVKNLCDIMKSDKRYEAVESAAAVYNADERISTAMTEYSVQQTALAEEYAKPERDEALITAIQNRINEIYKEIIENPAYTVYKEASDEYEAYYKAVYAEIEYQLTGKNPECTHDCSTCSGCH